MDDIQQLFASVRQRWQVNTGFQPVEDNCTVEVRLNNGQLRTLKASQINWTLSSSPFAVDQFRRAPTLPY